MQPVESAPFIATAEAPRVEPTSEPARNDASAEGSKGPINEASSRRAPPPAPTVSTTPKHTPRRDSAARASCDPPYTIAPDGTKEFKVDCLH
jgi:hypothetical protein